VPANKFATRVDTEHADATLEHFGQAPLQSMDKARTALRDLPKHGATDTVPESIDAWVANRNWPSPPSLSADVHSSANRGHHWAGCVGPHGRSAAVGTTPYEAEGQHHRDCPFWAGVQHRGALPTCMRRHPHYRAGLIREAAACTVRGGSRCDISLQIVGKLGYPYRRLSERHVGLDRFTPDR